MTGNASRGDVSDASCSASVVGNSGKVEPGRTRVAPARARVSNNIFFLFCICVCLWGRYCNVTCGAVFRYTFV